MIDTEFAHLHPAPDHSMHVVLPVKTAEAAIEAGWAELHPIARRGIISPGAVMVYAPRDAVEADCYINVPIAKSHSIARLTLGLKNIMGMMGGNRGSIHRQLAPSLADLNSVIVSKFTLIDATRILLRHGPQGGNLDDVKVLDTLIASTDMVAADAYATTLFDLKPEDIASTVAGHEMGLGEINLDKVKIVNV